MAKRLVIMPNKPCQFGCAYWEWFTLDNGKQIQDCGCPERPRGCGFSSDEIAIYKEVGDDEKDA